MFGGKVEVMNSVVVSFAAQVLRGVDAVWERGRGVPECHNAGIPDGRAGVGGFRGSDLRAEEESLRGGLSCRPLWRILWWK